MSEATRRRWLLNPTLTQPVAMSAETRPHFCGCVQRVGSGSIARWGTNWDGTRWIGKPIARVIRWTMDPSVPASYKASLEWAWNEWAKVCAIKPVFVTYQPNPSAVYCEVIYQAGHIDGPSNTLAWAELPYGSDEQNPTLKSRIETAEQWQIDPLARPIRGVHLGGAMCHENGHLLGIEHDQSSERALMDPMYGPDVITPQPADIKQAQFRYGPPILEESPPTTPTPTPGAKPAVIEIDGMKWTGTLTRVV